MAAMLSAQGATGKTGAGQKAQEKFFPIWWTAWTSDTYEHVWIRVNNWVELWGFNYSKQKPKQIKHKAIIGGNQMYKERKSNPSILNGYEQY